MKKLDLSKINKEVEINWDVPQWVISKDGECLILTTGEYYENGFSGMAMPSMEYPCGEYSKTWTMDDFKRFIGSIDFKISNDE